MAPHPPSAVRRPLPAVPRDAQLLPGYNARPMQVEWHAERRRALLETMGEGTVALFPAAREATRNHDVEHPYRQDSDFFYLTGFEEPEALLILTRVHPEHRSVLLLRPRDPQREQWDGKRLGVEAAAERLGLDAAFPVEQWEERLADYLKGARRVLVALGRDRDFDERFFRVVARLRRGARRGVAAPVEFVDPSVSIHERRLVKLPEEAGAMRRAARLTVEGHRRAYARLRPGMHEYEVEAELLRCWRGRGSRREAYPSIVASGANATILHYRSNDRRMEEGDLLLVDAGAEWDYYAADVTRTVPVSGHFTDPQRALYTAVLEAQRAALEQVRPGATLDAVHQAAVRVLCEHLVALGLLQGPVERAIQEGRHRRFYPHRTSHWLGMDVHDVGAYHVEGRPRILRPGMALTVEPGLYVLEGADGVDPAWHGIGIRIEDDVLVTDDGYENLTADLPTDPDEVEALVGTEAS